MRSKSGESVNEGSRWLLFLPKKTLGLKAPRCFVVKGRKRLSTALASRLLEPAKHAQRNTPSRVISSSELELAGQKLAPYSSTPHATIFDRRQAVRLNRNQRGEQPFSIGKTVFPGFAPKSFVPYPTTTPHRRASSRERPSPPECEREESEPFGRRPLKDSPSGRGQNRGVSWRPCREEGGERETRGGGKSSGREVQASPMLLKAPPPSPQEKRKDEKTKKKKKTSTRLISLRLSPHLPAPPTLVAASAGVATEARRRPQSLASFFLRRFYFWLALATCWLLALLLACCLRSTREIVFRPDFALVEKAPVLPSTMESSPGGCEAIRCPPVFLPLGFWSCQSFSPFPFEVLKAPAHFPRSCPTSSR